MNRSIQAASTLAFALLALGASAPAQAQFYNLAGTGVQGIYGLSGDGSHAVGYSTGSYYRWTAGEGVSVISGATFTSGAPSISFDGNTAGLAMSVGGVQVAARYDWASGTLTPLGGIGGVSDGEASTTWGISGDGNTIVGLGWVNGGTAHAVYSAGSTLVDMGSTVPGRSTRANGANFDGSVIVGWQDGESGFRQGAVWNDGVQTLIFDADANPMGEVGDVSADGTWVVGVGTAANGNQAYRWSAATGVESLGILSFGDRSGASAISADGSVIVGYSRGFGPAQFGQGFIWTEETGMVNLTTYAHDLGFDTQGITLALPLAVSADGSTIAGLGSNGQGWILHLSPVPEPTTYALMGLGLAALALRRRVQG